MPLRSKSTVASVVCANKVGAVAGEVGSIKKPAGLNVDQLPPPFDEYAPPTTVVGPGARFGSSRVQTATSLCELVGSTTIDGLLWLPPALDTSNWPVTNAPGIVASSVRASSPSMTIRRILDLRSCVDRAPGRNPMRAFEASTSVATARMVTLRCHMKRSRDGTARLG